MANAPRDENRVTALLGVSNIDGKTPVDIQTDPSTHELLVKASAGTNLNTSALATSANQTNGNQITQVLQKVDADDHNSSTTNLATPAFAFTGTSTSTLGIAGI